MTTPDPTSTPAVPLGAPLPLSDEELAILAEVTDEDIEAAKKLWRKANPEIGDLLDAVEGEP
jgi:hypothetical protein